MTIRMHYTERIHAPRGYNDLTQSEVAAIIHVVQKTYIEY